MVFLLWLLGSMAHAQVSPALWNASRIGATQGQVKDQLTAAGYEPRTVKWSEPKGLAAGTLDKPGLLAMLNHHRVRNRLMDGLPKAGPSFLLVQDDTATVVYAFVRNRLWAAAFGVTHQAMKPTSEPFDPNRLTGLTAIKNDLRARCGGLAVKRRDPYGNAREWRAGCGTGKAFAHYTPEADTPMRILLVGSGG